MTNRGDARRRTWLGGMAMLLPAAVLVLTPGCRSLHLPGATIQDDRDWLTEGGSPDRSYARDVEFRFPLKEAWEYNAGGGFGPGSPLIVNDAVLVGTRKGEVHAIDFTTGKSRGVLGVGESVDGTPVIDRQGIMYVPVSWGRRGVHAYDLTRGTSLWRQQRIPVEAGLLLMEDRLIAADVESRVIAYELRSGDVIWEQTLSDRAIVHAAPVRSGSNQFVVADDGGFVTGLNASDGTVLWEAELAHPVYATPAASDGIVYVPTTRGVLVALDAETGTERFVFDVGLEHVKLTTPAIEGNVLVVAGSNGGVYAVDRFSGDTLWTYAGGEAIGAPPLIVSGFIFVADMAKSLRALDLDTGELVWEEELEGRVKSAMAVGDQGLVVLAEPRSVFLFKSAETHVTSQ